MEGRRSQRERERDQVEVPSTAMQYEGGLVKPSGVLEAGWKESCVYLGSRLLKYPHHTQSLERERLEGGLEVWPWCKCGGGFQGAAADALGHLHSCSRRPAGSILVAATNHSSSPVYLHQHTRSLASLL